MITLPNAYLRYKTDTQVRPAGFDAHVAHIAASLRRPNALRSIGAFARAPKANVAAHLPRIRVPVLAVLGDADPDYPDPAAEEAFLRAAVGGGRLTTVMLRGVGHYPHVEAPDEALPAVRDFLAAL